MKFSLQWSGVVALSASVLAGCGGGDGISLRNSLGNGVAASSYPFVTPAVGAQQVYSQTVIDNADNTIPQTLRDTVIAVRADGSYDDVQDDPTDNSLTVNGTLYAVRTETISVSNAGETESLSDTPTGESTSLECLFATSGATGKYPHSVGQSWNFTYTVTCGSKAPSVYTQMGSVVDLESVTVPAGTFAALKTLNTVTSTNATATTTTQTIHHLARYGDGDRDQADHELCLQRDDAGQWPPGARDAGTAETIIVTRVDVGLHAGHPGFHTGRAA